MECPGGVRTSCFSDAHSAAFLVGIFSRYSQSGAGRGVVWAKQKGHCTAGTWLEIVLALASNVVAPFAEMWPNQSGQIHWQV